jgi:hypothetical protein
LVSEIRFRRGIDGVCWASRRARRAGTPGGGKLLRNRGPKVLITDSSVALVSALGEFHSFCARRNIDRHQPAWLPFFLRGIAKGNSSPLFGSRWGQIS